jgi:hypothetical protein
MLSAYYPVFLPSRPKRVCLWSTEIFGSKVKFLVYFPSTLLLYFSSPSHTATLNVTKIWTYGFIEVGTWDNPYNGSLSVTIRGPKPLVGQTDMTGGDKSLFVASGGKIEFHGAKRASWTRLASTANPGAMYIDVFDAVWM